MNISVDADALRKVLTALCGPAHLIRELQVAHDLGTKGLADDDPVGKLVENYRQAASDLSAILRPVTGFPAESDAEEMRRRRGFFPETFRDESE